MATIIKMLRKGSIHRPYWWIVVTDCRKPKGCLEQLGTYNTLKKPSELKLDREKALAWLGKGALPTPTVKSIFKREGLTVNAKQEKA